MSQIDGETDEGALKNFEVIIDSTFSYSHRVYSDSAIYLEGQYNYNNRLYELQYKLIPQKAGLFYFSQATLLYPAEEDQEFSGKCRNKSSEADVEMNNGADNNIDLLKESPDEHFNTWILEKPEERFHGFGGYCFWVEE